ncbi:protein white [Lingula anatina]|uniref:Protein white n=1 Tax=Lingula anatina TaxID=7574 RepID=A0A1S3HZ11_LINAN|nr:protein white [Lingula anatina]|eukprot:XP_013391243.1 protein white [Lingula anatina]
MSEFHEVDETHERAPLISKDFAETSLSNRKTTSYSALSIEKGHPNGGFHGSSMGHDKQPNGFMNGKVSHGGGEHGYMFGGRKRVLSTRLSFSESFDKIKLTWHDINVFVPPPERKWFHCLRNGDGRAEPGAKQILSNVSGYVEPGTLLAILGASGAGKTTLLNVLNSRNRGNLIVDGDIRVNDKLIGKGITSVSAYVQQDDVFVGALKVKEHLWFQAMLRMDPEISFKDRERRMKEVMHEMSLTKCQDTSIGIPGRVKGISGGEMKRLSFAAELLTNPPLMFCDEPTSGLDSYMAQNVVDTLKRMAATGKTVVCTIHQPSSEVFAMFDRILLMAEGRVAYMGPAKDTLEYFKSGGFTCPVNYNPADFFIHTLAIVPGEEAECQDIVKRVCHQYQNSDYRDAVLKKVAKNYSDHTQYEEAFADRSPYKATWLEQFRAVTWRCGLSNIRNPGITRTRLFQTLFIAVVVGLIYWQQPNSQAAVQNINGAMFLWLTNMTFANCLNVVNTFPLEMPVFRREHHNGMYRADVYFLGKMAAELPIFLFLPVIFVTISYWMIGLYPTADAFFYSMAVVTLVTLVAVSWGYIVSCVTDDIVISTAIAPPSIMPLLLFGGFFLNNASIPPYFTWLSSISWFTYANELLVTNQWANYGNITCAGADSTRCYQDGHDVISSLAFTVSDETLNWVVLGAMILIFRIFAFICFLLRSYKK